MNKVLGRLEETDARLEESEARFKRLSRQVSDAGPTMRNQRIKVEGLDKYGGSPDPNVIDEFLFVLEESFEDTTAETVKISTAKRYLTREALSWFLCTDAQTFEDEEGEASFAIFTDELRAQFLPPDYRDKCLLNLLKASQGSSSAAEYVNRFRRMTLRVKNVPEDVLRMSFLNGLAPSVANYVECNSRDESVKEYMRLALIGGRVLTTAKPKGKEPFAAMEKENRRPLRKKPVASVLCYGCGKSGHYKADCPKTKEIKLLENYGSDSWSESFFLNGIKKTVHMDTGSFCNLISLKMIKVLDALPKLDREKRIELKGLWSRPIESYGEVILSVNNHGMATEEPFVVVQEDLEFPLMGCPYIKKNYLDPAKFGSLKTGSGILEVEVALRGEGEESSEACGDLTPELEDLINRCSWDEHNPSTMKGVTQEIRVKAGSKPCYRYYRESNEEKRRAMEEEVETMLRNGVIEKKPWSTKGWNLQPLMVPKTDGTWRLTSNLKELNKNVEFSDFEIPKEEDLVRSAAGHKIFSKLDCAKGYWQVPLHEESRHYTAFTIEKDGRRQQYQYRVMPMGLVDSGFVYQRHMQQVLGDLVGVYVYIDDILIASQDAKTHEELLRKVLERLLEYNVKVKRAKCEFFREEVEFLGRKIGKGRASIKDNAVEYLIGKGAPRDKDELRSWYATVNWWHKYLPDVTRVLAPISDLLKKEKKFKWASAQEEAYEKFLELLKSVPKLYAPLSDDRLILQTDASLVGAGMALYVIRKENGVDVKYPVCFHSTKWTKAQNNYSIGELEALAIVYAVERWEGLIKG